MDQGESVEQSAQRELMEETGYFASIENFKQIGTAYPVPALSSLRFHFVGVENVEYKQTPQLEPSENLVTLLLTENQIEDEVFVQGPCDSSLLTGWSFLKRFKKAKL